MKIWLISPYASMPQSGWREDRYSMMAKTLVEGGHHVVQWISNFCHREKIYVQESFGTCKIAENHIISIVPSTYYKKHISFERILYEKNFGKNLLKFSDGFTKPDVILVTIPCLFYQKQISELIQRYNCRLIVDIIDLWPELFKIALPNKLRFLGPAIFYPLKRRRNKLIRLADAVITASETYSTVARKVLNSNSKKPVQTIYWGIEPSYAQNSSVCILPTELQTLLNNKLQNDIWVVFSGTFGINYDIKTIIEGAKKLQGFNSKIKFIFAGSGPLEGYINDEISKNLENCYLVGKLTPEQLNILYKNCSIGLNCYKADSTVSTSIKFFDYVFFGLAIINSLCGEIENIISNDKIGSQYKAENVDSFCKAITELTSNSETLNTARNSALILSKNYTRLAQYTKLLNIIDGLSISGSYEKDTAWIICPTDPHPSEQRIYKRSLLYGEYLASKGFHVELFISNFSHFDKTRRCKGWGKYPYSPNINFNLVPIRDYKSNFSITRAMTYLDFAINLYSWSQKNSKPRLIISTLPNPFIDFVLCILHNRFNFRLIVDVRDLWPEFIVNYTKPVYRQIVSLLTYPLVIMRKHLLQKTTGLISVSSNYIQTLKNQIPNLKTVPSEHIYTLSISLEQFKLLSSSNICGKDTITKNKNEKWFLYSGSLGLHYDLITLIEVTNQLQNIGLKNIRILIAGSGPLSEQISYVSKNENNSNLVFLGNLNKEELCYYYGQSDVGLAPYVSSSTVDIPAKAVEYLAAGLPILSSLKSNFFMSLYHQGACRFYESGNSESLLNEIIFLYKSETLCQEMSQNAEKLAHQFDPSIQIRKLDNVLNID